MGVEHEADLLADLAQALAHAAVVGPVGDAAGAVGYAAQAAVERPIGVVGDGMAGAVGAVGDVLGAAGGVLMNVWPLGGSVSEPPSPARGPEAVDLRHQHPH